MSTRPLASSFVPVTVLLLLSLAPAARAEQNMAGTYKDNKLQVTLAPAAGGTYTGQVEMAGKTFPLNANAAGNLLTGKFSQGAASFDFTATLSGSTLSFKTGSATYRLEREGGAPPAAGNPLENGGGGPPPTEAIPVDKINQAIQKGVAFLRSRQKNGNWDLPARAREPRPDAMGRVNVMDIQNSSQWGGVSALCTYAMLASGEKDTDPDVARAIGWLKTADINGTYALGCRALVWSSVPASRKKDYRDVAKKDAELLLKLKKSDDKNKGLFRYNQYDTVTDNSASQFGLLGLWACNQVGIEVPASFWKEAEASWIANQDASGGWNYGSVFTPRPAVSASMTAAGIASLFIINDMLHGDQGIDCRGNVPHKQIDAGIKWINEHYDSVFTGSWPYYSLYGVERIGLASGYKYLGSVDWFRHGALRLIGTQQPNGSWGESLSDTCFGILFLSRGRNPVVMNKLRYSLDNHGDKAREANWNERPRDAANFTKWLSRQLERDLNWQIVSLENPIEDLHDAPILYIAGNQLLSFTAAEEKKLKAFVEQGGLIVGQADCSFPGFGASFKKLGSKLFGYEFRDLPTNHVIYSALYDRKNWRMPMPVQGLSNGAREFMLLFGSGDPARFWQTGTYLGREPAHEVMANIFMYVSEKRDLRYKGDSWVVWPNPAATPARHIKVARLEYAGNWDPEPGGWKRLSAILQNQNEAALTVDPVKLGDGKLSPAEYKLAHLTSPHKFTLNDAQRAELKAYVEGGGTLLVDACGGNGDAVGSIESELSATWPKGGQPQLIPADSPVFAHLGAPADQLTFRAYAARHVGATRGPRLRGVAVGGRPAAVVYSPEDLSVGLVGQPIDGIIGYTPNSATAIVRSVALGVK
jgi:hypothetical protein